MPRGHLYDVFGNVLSVKAGSYTLATYEYAGNNGKLLKLTYGNGDYEEYIYDSLERLVQTKLNGVSEYIVKYDNNGRLYSLTEDGATHIYEYDSLDRLIRAWQEDEDGNYVVAVENSYDNLGRAKGSTYVVGDRTMSYTVNYKANSNLVGSVSMPAADEGYLMSSLHYSYDGLERLTSKEISLSTMATLYEDYAYYGYEVTTDEGTENRTTALVSNLTQRVSYGGNTTSAVYSYIYDKLGNITQIKKDGVLVESYEYDSLGQLTREDNAPANYSVFYSYDKSGNLTKSEKFTFSSAPTWHMAAVFGTGTVMSYTYGNSTWGDMLTNYNGTAITYDAIGNPLKWRNSSSLTWAGRTLTAQTLNSDDRLTYSYNSNGIRTQKQFYDYMTGDYRTYNYVLDGTIIIKETVSDRAYNLNYTFYYLYDASGSVVGFIYNNAYYYFQKNLQGDVVRILNSSGTVVVEYTYDAWGKVLSVTGSQASTIGQYNPFRYRSYYYDVETGFYYLQSRYYDPTVGRFLNADGIVGANGEIIGNNMYIYCSNAPIAYNSTSQILRNGYAKIISSNTSLMPNLRQEPLEYVTATPAEILVYYAVPLYDQNGFNLCWAFCQVMVEDYYQGVIRSNDEATARAIAIAIERHGAQGIEDKETWDQGISMSSGISIGGIVELYTLLVEYGPLFATYSNGSNAHRVVVTGVDLTNGIIYTNNPWKEYGEQTYEEFLQGFAAMGPALDMTFYTIHIFKEK